MCSSMISRTSRWRGVSVGVVDMVRMLLRWRSALAGRQALGSSQRPGLPRAITPNGAVEMVRTTLAQATNARSGRTVPPAIAHGKHPFEVLVDDEHRFVVGWMANGRSYRCRA